MRCGAQCNFGVVAEDSLRCNFEKHVDGVVEGAGCGSSMIYFELSYEWAGPMLQEASISQTVGLKRHASRFKHD